MHDAADDPNGTLAVSKLVFQLLNANTALLCTVS